MSTASEDSRRRLAGASITGEIPMTYAEFCTLPESSGLQLIDGLVVAEPSPGRSHQSATGKLFAEFYRFVNERRLGEVYAAPFDVTLKGDPVQVVQPDVLFVAAERLGLVQARGVFGTPDLVVEVLSSSTRRYDLGRKRELYLAHGCRELWLIDPAVRTVEVAHPAGDHWSAQTYTARDVIASSVLSGFEIEASELFERQYRGPEAQ